MTTTTVRRLKKNELPRILNDIDRTEQINRIYIPTQGELVKTRVDYTILSWSPEQIIRLQMEFDRRYDRGDLFLALFQEEKMVGVGCISASPLSSDPTAYPLFFMHVCNGHRGKGIGKQLFSELLHTAEQHEAEKIYISANCNCKTVDFYLGLGCEWVQNPPQELVLLEPNDIHMIYTIVN